MSETPEHYHEGKARVSDILSSLSPFEGSNEQKRFRLWLKEAGVSETEYMEEASYGGSFIHDTIDGILRSLHYKNVIEVHGTTPYAPYMNQWCKAKDELELVPYNTELHIHNDNIQGTLDYYGLVNGEEAIVDWKTWKLAQYRFNLHLDKDGKEKKYRKPYAKLKKVKVQLSLYRYLLGKEVKLYVVELLREDYKIYELEYIGDEECEKIINQYSLTKQDNGINNIITNCDI